MSETLKVYGKTYTNVAGIKASTPTGETKAFTIGTDDYEELNNLPSINDVELIGNKTAAQLGLAAASDIPTVPVQSVNGKTGAVVLSASDVGAGTYSKPSGGIPKTDLATAVQTSLGKADTALQTAPVTSVNSKTGAVELSASDVGAYVLPANGIPDSDIASAATWNAKGTYSKPSGGIPKTDLASAVQTSLGKADTALQSHQSLAAYRTSADQDTIDATKITKPVSPVSGQSLVFDGTDWISKANLFIVGGTVSSTSLTISDSRITANSYLISLLSLSIDIGSQLLYWTTTDGAITFNGTFSSPTTIYVIMADIN